MDSTNKVSAQVLAEVQNRISALPFDLREIVIERGFRPVGFRFVEYIFSIKATLGDEEIIATGEDSDLQIAQAKVISELAERAALFQLGSGFGAKSSNGWAAHETHEMASDNAIYELIERDAVLSQWYSSTSFPEIRQCDLPGDIQTWAANELSRSEFPNLKILLSTEGIGPSVTCVLKNQTGFGVSGHATKRTIDGAIRSAITEACRAAHLSLRRVNWWDSVKLKNLKAENLAPGSHATFYAYHEPFPEWMFGKEVSIDEARVLWSQRIEASLNDTQFDYQPVLTLPLAIGFATHPNAFQLSWGSTDAAQVLSTGAALRMNLKLDQINERPHIVA